MDVLVADLDEDAAAVVQQIPRDDKPIAQVRQVGVDSQLPRVAKGPDYLRFLRYIGSRPVPNVAPRGRRLPVRSESDAIRRVHIDGLHLATEPLLLGER